MSLNVLVATPFGSNPDSAGTASRRQLRSCREPTRSVGDAYRNRPQVRSPGGHRGARRRSAVTCLARLGPDTGGRNPASSGSPQVAREGIPLLRPHDRHPGSSRPRFPADKESLAAARIAGPHSKGSAPGRTIWPSPRAPPAATSCSAKPAWRAASACNCCCRCPSPNSSPPRCCRAPMANPGASATWRYARA